MTLTELEKIFGPLTNAPSRPRADDITARIVRDALAGWQERPCPFRPGDLVIVREGSPTWKSTLGVCAVLRLVPPTRQQDPAMMHRVIESDMHVVMCNGDESTIVVAVSSRDFRAYTGPVAGDGA